MEFLARLWSNWVSLLGASLTTCAGLAIVLVFGFGLFGTGANPYAGALLIVALPMVFVAGLVLMPFGLYLDRRARRKRGAAGDPVSPLQAFGTALGSGTGKRLLIFFAVATVANVLILGAGGQAAVHEMDTARFCGTTCHTVMEPEWASYSDSRHSRVACVQCHIGPGESWAVKAKINGLRQVWAVLTHTYDRPIPVPVEKLRPSRDTCEQCHWPAEFNGNKVISLPHFKADETNSAIYNVMVMRIGGRDRRTGQYVGIHWHVGADTEVRFQQLDRARDKIGKISLYKQGKLVAEYLPPEKDRALPSLETRTMDCVDCHNRSAHQFDQSPAAAVDRAMGAGELDPKAPWLAQVSAGLLAIPDLPEAGSGEHFRTALAETYRAAHPGVTLGPDTLAQAAATLTDLYRRNNYPGLNIGWGTYRSRVGHKHEGDKGAEVGCFRCHDGEHQQTLADGSKKTLSQSCELCHEQVVAGEDPAKLEPDVKSMLPK